MAKTTDFRYNTGATRVPWAAVGENYNAHDLMEIIRFLMQGEGKEYDDAINAVWEQVRKLGEIATPPGKLSLASKVAAAEQACNDYLGIDTATFVTNATAGFEIASKYANLQPGDEVIVPAYTYTASASVVCHVGAKLVLIDCQKDSLEMDYDAVEAAINERTKAIIPVDLGGVPCDYDRLFSVVENKRSVFAPNSDIQKALGRVAIMADTAHAFGAKLGSRMIGAVADFSSFSFHAVKNLTTAEGGALTWRTITGVDDDAIYKQLQLLSLHGQSKDALAKTKLGAWEYDIVGTWYKCNMTDVTASIGLKQLERYSGMLERRKEIVSKYDAALKPLGVKVLTHYTDAYESSGHLYLTWIPGITAEQRNEIIIKMAEAGIACNVHYKPLPLHTAYKNMGFDIQNFPNAYAHFVNEISLPLHTCLTDEQVEYVVENYVKNIKEYLK